MGTPVAVLLTLGKHHNELVEKQSQDYPMPLTLGGDVPQTDEISWVCPAFG